MVNILKLNTEDLKTLVMYKDVIKNNKRFPKNFWTEEILQISETKPRCQILTRYCLENLNGLEIKDLPNYNLNQIKTMLINGKLLGMVQRVFNHDVLEILKNAYPQEFKNRTLKEWLWSKHGLWHNDELIIEAVKYMVNKEGIRRIEDIPKYDWKKRLLKYGIYNVLSYFNWSIYALFNFVYPNKFHPADFKYKIKWKNENCMNNAFYFMYKIFKKKRYSIDDVIMLNSSDFRRLGLAGMLITVFNGSILKAKEYYLYKTVGNKENQHELISDMKRIAKNRQNETIKNRLKKVAVGKYIYNLHHNYTLYNYIKRHAKKSNMSIGKFIAQYGFKYKSAYQDINKVSKDDIWNLRKQGFTYVQIAEKLDSNPTTISQMCTKYFGGDPLIPRPIDDYITVQELMDTFHVDHKTVMKIVKRNGFENHTTIRFRYLKKSEIIPALKIYIRKNSLHKAMVKRYSVNNSKAKYNY